MIKLTATALIHSISPVIQVSDKFQKRELVLNDSWERDGEQHLNFVVIEFTGDKMAQLDNFIPGQRVTVEAFINGREYQGRYYNSIRGQRVAHYQPQQSPSTMGQRPAAAPTSDPQQYPQAPAAYPQTAQAYPQAAPVAAYPQNAPAYPQGAPAAPQSAPAYPQPGNPYGQQSAAPGVADLPFPH